MLHLPPTPVAQNFPGISPYFTGCKMECSSPCAGVPGWIWVFPGGGGENIWPGLSPSLALCGERISQFWPLFTPSGAAGGGGGVHLVSEFSLRSCAQPWEE